MNSDRDKLIELDKSIINLKGELRSWAKQDIEERRIASLKAEAFKNFNPITDTIVSKEQLMLNKGLIDIAIMKEQIASISQYVEQVKYSNIKSENKPDQKLTKDQEVQKLMKVWTANKRKF